MIFVSLVVIASSLAAIVSIEAAARGRLGINSLIGLRVSSVMSSDEAWQRGHAAARIPVWIGAGGAVVGSVISIVLPESVRSEGQTASTVVLVLGVVVGGIFASRAARAVMPPVFDDHPPKDSRR